MINKDLASDLELRKDIGEVYLGLAPFLKLYATYCESHNQALDLVAKLKKKKKDFAAFDEVLLLSFFFLLNFFLKQQQINLINFHFRN